MNGYKEASKIDKQINDLFSEHPMSEENALEWINFARTVRSTLEIIEEHAKNTLDRKTERIAAETAKKSTKSTKSTGNGG